jgi:hypothetical protein
MNQAPRTPAEWTKWFNDSHGKVRKEMERYEGKIKEIKKKCDPFIEDVIIRTAVIIEMMNFFRHDIISLRNVQALHFIMWWILDLYALQEKSGLMCLFEAFDSISPTLMKIGCGMYKQTLNFRDVLVMIRNLLVTFSKHLPTLFPMIHDMTKELNACHPPLHLDREFHRFQSALHKIIKNISKMTKTPTKQELAQPTCPPCIDCKQQGCCPTNIAPLLGFGGAGFLVGVVLYFKFKS